MAAYLTLAILLLVGGLVGIFTTKDFKDEGIFATYYTSYIVIIASIFCFLLAFGVL
jgi:hypothetical protein